MGGCAQSNTDQVLDRVIGLVKKFDKIDSSNKASVIVHVSLHSKIDIYAKDLSLDSLDRVEL